MGEYITEIKVRGYHIDLLGHVNNARFLEFIEQGRWDFLDTFMVDMLRQEQNMSGSVVHIDISYRRPAYFGEVLEVKTSLSDIGTTSVTLCQDIVLKGTQTMIVNARVTLVLIDTNTNRPACIEGELRTLLEGLV